MAVETDILQIVLRGTLNGQQLRNVFHYLPDAEIAPSELEGLAAEFEDLFFGVADIGLRQEAFSNQITYTGLRVTNLFDDSMLYDTVFDTPYEGGTSAQPLPPFCCVGFKSTQTRGDVRSGQKRFSGVIEDAAQDGFVLSAFDADLDDLGVKLGTSLVPDATAFAPVVVKRVFVPATETEPAKYILPATRAAATVASANEWTTTRLITSQNTRKIGRGI